MLASQCVLSIKKQIRPTQHVDIIIRDQPEPLRGRNSCSLRSPANFCWLHPYPLPHSEVCILGSCLPPPGLQHPSPGRGRRHPSPRHLSLRGRGQRLAFVRVFRVGTACCSSLGPFVGGLSPATPRSFQPCDGLRLRKGELLPQGGQGVHSRAQGLPWPQTPR